MEELLQRIRALSFPLLPDPTSVEAVLQPLGDIESVLFDIYGTLFISGSGDIGLARKDDRESVMREVLTKMELPGPGNQLPSLEKFHALILAAHAESRGKGVDFPEVEIRDIWRELLHGLDPGAVSDSVLERLAVEYECRVNPVWPMPGARTLLTECKDRDLVLGIISNAQFFTPLLFEALLEKPVEAWGFSPDLCLWSYAGKRAKPSPRLFEVSRDKLVRLGVAPQRTLYVGNDMRNDIAPAAAAGFRTALFAGDARSLRLREGEPAGEVLPDLVLTGLAQLAGCLV